MFKQLKEEWSQLKRGHPGSRFEKQHERNTREARNPFGRGLRVAAGLLLFPVGLFLLAFPGPGMLVIAIGAVLIAREFRWAAKVLDRFEVRARDVFSRLRRTWRRVARRAA